MNSMMEYRGYHASIEYDAEDKIFVGEVFGINDSLNFHGSSVDELEEMFHQSIDNYLDICARFNKEPDKEFKGTFNVRIPPDMHRQIALQASIQKITLNQFIIKSLEKSLSEINNIEKETIIYIPYGVQEINWKGNDNNLFSNYRLEGMQLGRKEETSYVTS